jgi:two-component system chemotaxis sensor kinase CheA
VRTVRRGGAWSELPVIALTARSGTMDADAGRDAGFTDYVHKTQREALIESLRQCLGEQVGLMSSDVA